MKSMIKTCSLLLTGVLLAGAASAQLASDKPTQPIKAADAQKNVAAQPAVTVSTASSVAPTTTRPAAEKKVVAENKAKVVTPSQGTEPAKAATIKAPVKLAPVSEQQATTATPAAAKKSNP